MDLADVENSAARRPAQNTNVVVSELRRVLREHGEAAEKKRSMDAAKNERGWRKYAKEVIEQGLLEKVNDASLQWMQEQQGGLRQLLSEVQSATGGLRVLPDTSVSCPSGDELLMKVEFHSKRPSNNNDFVLRVNSRDHTHIPSAMAESVDSVCSHIAGIAYGNYVLEMSQRQNENNTAQILDSHNAAVESSLATYKSSTEFSINKSLQCMMHNIETQFQHTLSLSASPTSISQVDPLVYTLYASMDPPTNLYSPSSHPIPVHFGQLIAQNEDEAIRVDEARLQAEQVIVQAAVQWEGVKRAKRTLETDVHNFRKAVEITKERAEEQRQRTQTTEKLAESRLLEAKNNELRLAELRMVVNTERSEVAAKLVAVKEQLQAAEIARREAERMLEEARRAAEMINEDARKAAQRMLEDARRTAERMFEEARRAAAGSLNKMFSNFKI